MTGTTYSQDPAMGGIERAMMARQHLLAISGAVGILDLLQELFTHHQYGVTTTNYVERSFEMIEATQPDIVVLDLVLHDRAGWDMLARLHDELSTRGIPVIAVSTEQGILDEVLAQPGAYGLPATLMLPMDVPTILTQVRRMIPAEA